MPGLLLSIPKLPEASMAASPGLPPVDFEGQKGGRLRPLKVKAKEAVYFQLAW
jgi:hypothetical protein